MASFLSFLLGEQQKTASVAQERLQIILAHERNGRNAAERGGGRDLQVRQGQPRSPPGAPGAPGQPGSAGSQDRAARYGALRARVRAKLGSGAYLVSASSYQN